MMAKIHGRLSNFSWNATAVNGIVDTSLNLERPEIDVTTHDTGDFREFISGRLAGTVDLTMKWDEADAGQGAMQTDLIAGTQRAIFFRMETASGKHSFTGTGQITSWTPSGPNDDAGEVSANVRFSGNITEATQA
jgi:predicted secreted protein